MLLDVGWVLSERLVSVKEYTEKEFNGNGKCQPRCHRLTNSKTSE
jgi:hypothetical protein